jgi:Xaa-Pro dipeptidase
MRDPERANFPQTQVDPGRMHLARLGRLRAELRRIGCAGGLFYDPTNIRYATGTSNMQVYALHNPCRYVFVATEGPVVLFEFKRCEHLSSGFPAVSEVRPAVSWYHFVAGDRVAEKVRLWAGEIAALVRAHGGGDRRLAVDRLDPPGLHALERLGVAVIDGQEPINLARAIKTPDEIVALREAVAVCEDGLRRMQAARAPGLTEIALWSHLHQANIELGGEWIETRLLNSGPRTNPWYQEASARVIENGDMIAFDSDLIGPHGYSADISRSWLAGDRCARDDQRRLYAAAYTQVQANIELFRPGMTFREIAEGGHLLPEHYAERQEGCIAHGIGLCNEYPLVLHLRHFAPDGHDGVVQENMVFCVESYAADVHGGEGVKLEEQILVTATGPVRLSNARFEEGML